ncbi:MAG: TonB family protein [Spirochaetales bacterium]|nr:TonB family protein [Spirochaetales bacterium]
MTKWSAERRPGLMAVTLAASLLFHVILFFIPIPQPEPREQDQLDDAYLSTIRLMYQQESEGTAEEGPLSTEAEGEIPLDSAPADGSAADSAAPVFGEGEAETAEFPEIPVPREFSEPPREAFKPGKTGEVGDSDDIADSAEAERADTAGDSALGEGEEPAGAAEAAVSAPELSESTEPLKIAEVPERPAFTQSPRTEADLQRMRELLSQASDSGTRTEDIPDVQGFPNETFTEIISAEPFFPMQVERRTDIPRLDFFVPPPSAGGADGQRESLEQVLKSQIVVPGAERETQEASTAEVRTERPSEDAAEKTAEEAAEQTAAEDAAEAEPEASSQLSFRSVLPMEGFFPGAEDQSQQENLREILRFLSVPADTPKEESEKEKEEISEEEDVPQITAAPREERDDISYDQLLQAIRAAMEARRTQEDLKAQEAQEAQEAGISQDTAEIMEERKVPESQEVPDEQKIDRTSDKVIDAEETAVEEKVAAEEKTAEEETAEEKTADSKENLEKEAVEAEPSIRETGKEISPAETPAAEKVLEEESRVTEGMRSEAEKLEAEPKLQDAIDEKMADEIPEEAESAETDDQDEAIFPMISFESLGLPNIDLPEESVKSVKPESDSGFSVETAEGLKPSTSASALKTKETESPRFIQAGEVEELEGLPKPVYPQIARRKAWSGYVVVEIVVGSSGRVAQITTIDKSGNNVFEEAVREAVSSWSFKERKEPWKTRKRFEFTMEESR